MQKINFKALGRDPFQILDSWILEAKAFKEVDAEAMTLATATPDGKPSGRIVLYKGIHEGGIVFYTNYESRKGHELLSNPQAALVFYWYPLYRQVRVEGRVEKMSQVESEHYFSSRPRASQIGAWASPQSAPITSPDQLAENYSRYEKQFLGKEVPCPPHWGGFKLIPDHFEFWLGQERRLHDRVLYEKHGQNWKISFLGA